MSRRASTVLAWSLWALSVMLFASSWRLNILAPQAAWEEESPLFNVLYAVLALTYQTVGAVVASRRPENPIGWNFLGTGLFANAFQGFAFAYADYSLYVRNGSLLGTEYMAWFSYWIALPFSLRSQAWLANSYYGPSSAFWQSISTSGVFGSSGWQSFRASSLALRSGRGGTEAAAP